jgi:hypothetical protein
MLEAIAHAEDFGTGDTRPRLLGRAPTLLSVTLLGRSLGSRHGRQIALK